MTLSLSTIGISADMGLHKEKNTHAQAHKEKLLLESGCKDARPSLPITLEVIDGVASSRARKVCLLQCSCDFLQ
jgi:hypothetical protein